MNWTPKATPPDKAAYPLVWVKEWIDGLDHEYACFSYFFPALNIKKQWSIENDKNIEVLFWMDIESPYQAGMKNNGRKST